VDGEVVLVAVNNALLSAWTDEDEADCLGTCQTGHREGHVEGASLCFAPSLKPTLTSTPSRGTCEPTADIRSGSGIYHRLPILRSKPEKRRFDGLKMVVDYKNDCQN
jgi:hypothetical protein